jgi:hypothetical protein
MPKEFKPSDIRNLCLKISEGKGTIKECFYVLDEHFGGNPTVEIEALTLIVKKLVKKCRQ